MALLFGHSPGTGSAAPHPLQAANHSGRSASKHTPIWPLAAFAHRKGCAEKHRRACVHELPSLGHGLNFQRPRKKEVHRQSIPLRCKSCTCAFLRVFSLLLYPFFLLLHSLHSFAPLFRFFILLPLNHLYRVSASCRVLFYLRWVAIPRRRNNHDPRPLPRHCRGRASFLLFHSAQIIITRNITFSNTASR